MKGAVGDSESWIVPAFGAALHKAATSSAARIPAISFAVSVSSGAQAGAPDRFAVTDDRPCQPRTKKLSCGITRRRD